MGTAVQTLQRTGPLTDEEAELAAGIAKAVMLGYSLREIEEEGGVPAATVLGWLQRDEEFTKFYNECRKISAYWFEDEALHTARQTWKTKVRDPNLLRNSADYQKRLEWMAKMRNPAVFGDKVQVQQQVPITFITNLDLGEGAAKSELGNTYTVRAIVRKTVDASEVPADFTPILDAEGEVVLVEETGESPPADAPPEEDEGEQKSGSVRRFTPGRGKEEVQGSTLPPPKEEKDRRRPGRVAKVSNRKAGPMEGKKT